MLSQASLLMSDVIKLCIMLAVCTKNKSVKIQSSGDNMVVLVSWNFPERSSF